MALAATISGTLKGVPVAIEVLDEVFRRFERYKRRTCMTTDGFIARVTKGGSTAFTPAAVEDFLHDREPSEGEELADIGVAPTG
jgi:hypothetical protein